MFRKLKASLGFGAASVDTVIENSTLFQGEMLTGKIYVKGGDLAQDIDAISLKLCTEVKVESEDNVSYQAQMLAKFAVTEPFRIAAGELKEFHFAFTLPGETPITEVSAKKNQCKVWLETELDIPFALDATDKDHLTIKPLMSIQHLLSILARQGFRLVKADVEKGYLNGGHFRSISGCYQELEFLSAGFLSQREIELSFILQDEQIHCLLEIDGVRGRSDSYKSFSFSPFASEQQIEHLLLQVLHF